MGAANRWPTLPRVQQEQKIFGCRRDDDGTKDINRRRYDRRNRLRRQKGSWLVGRNPCHILDFPAAQLSRRTGTRRKREEDSVGNTIGPRNAPNPARPAFPRPEAGALYPPDIGSTWPGPDYSTRPARESPELPRFQVRILQSPLFFLFWGSFSRRIGGRVPFRTTNQTPQNPPGRLRISGPGFRPEFVVIWVSI